MRCGKRMGRASDVVVPGVWGDLHLSVTAQKVLETFPGFP